MYLDLEVLDLDDDWFVCLLAFWSCFASYVVLMMHYFCERRSFKQESSGERERDDAIRPGT